MYISENHIIRKLVQNALFVKVKHLFKLKDKVIIDVNYVRNTRSFNKIQCKLTARFTKKMLFLFLRQAIFHQEAIHYMITSY